jgi:hypothetical protein
MRRKADIHITPRRQTENYDKKTHKRGKDNIYCYDLMHAGHRQVRETGSASRFSLGNSVRLDRGDELAWREKERPFLSNLANWRRVTS